MPEIVDVNAPPELDHASERSFTSSNDHESVISPVFILAPPRSFTSIVCAIIGQHPDMYGLPELNLFNTATMVEWWKLGDKATFPRVDGALRTIAELFFGGQNEQTIREARGWLRRRSYLTTGTLLEL